MAGKSGRGLLSVRTGRYSRPLAPSVCPYGQPAPSRREPLWCGVPAAGSLHRSTFFHFTLDKWSFLWYHTLCRCECSSSGRAPPCQGGGSEFEPRHSLHFFGALCCSIWCHSQVVRQSSAKAPLPSSNLGGTSKIS